MAKLAAANMRFSTGDANRTVPSLDDRYAFWRSPAPKQLMHAQALAARLAKADFLSNATKK
jgi:hypothetical protein